MAETDTGVRRHGDVWQPIVLYLIVEFALLWLFNRI